MYLFFFKSWPHLFSQTVKTSPFFARESWEQNPMNSKSWSLNMTLKYQCWCDIADNWLRKSHFCFCPPPLFLLFSSTEESLVLGRQRTPRRSFSIWPMWPLPTRPRKTRSVIYSTILCHNSLWSSPSPLCFSLYSLSYSFFSFSSPCSRTLPLSEVGLVSYGPLSARNQAFPSPQCSTTCTVIVCAFEK